MKTWKIGIIGAGAVAPLHARAVAEIPGASVAGFCDAGSGRAEALTAEHGGRAFDSFEAMVQDETVNAVIVATPSGLHLEPTLAAAEAGKHVLCEKPLEVTLERVDAMIDAHRRSGTHLGGIFQNRFSDVMIPIRAAIQGGWLGTVTCAGIHVPWWRSSEYYRNPWRGTWKLDGGGALMNQAIHMVDLLVDLMPPVTHVQAFADTLGHPEIETEDTVAAALRFKGGALGLLHGTTASFPGRSRRFEITGTRGTVICVDEQITLWQFDEKRREDEEIRERFGITRGGSGAANPMDISYRNHQRNIQAFLEAIEEGKEFVLNGNEARKAVELVLAVYESARKNQGEE